MHWGWVGAAVLFDILVYFLAGLAMESTVEARRERAVRAIYPCDLRRVVRERDPSAAHGRIIRCYLQGRWSKLPFT